jgi:hypothetical protein
MLVTCPVCGLQTHAGDCCEHCNHRLRCTTNVASSDVAQRLSSAAPAQRPKEDADEDIPVVLPAPRTTQPADVISEAAPRVFARRVEPPVPTRRWPLLVGVSTGVALGLVVLGVATALLFNYIGGRPATTSAPAGIVDKRPNAQEQLALSKARPLSHDTIKKILDLAKPKRQDRLIDLGCGNGALAAQAFEDYGLTVVAYDSDPTLVSMAKRLLEDRPFPINPQVCGVYWKANVLDVDLKQAEIIVMAHPQRWGTLAEVSQHLEPRMPRLMAGVRIVSTQPILQPHPPLKSELFDPPDDPGRKYTLFLYETPL